MFRGFNIVNTTLRHKEQLAIKYDYEFKSCKKEIHNNYIENVKSFYIDSHTFDGETLMQEWFPNDQKFDIFLSHSHKDESFVKAMAYKLNKDFGLTCFIDSTIWKYVETLKKYITIKNEKMVYPLSTDQIAQHCYLMLNSSLLQAMKNCECLFFINTPSSINPSRKYYNSTWSPWLLSEISMFNSIMKEPPVRQAGIINENINFSSIKYKLDLSGLITLNADDLNKWVDNHDCKEHALDELYKEFPLLTRSLD